MYTSHPTYHLYTTYVNSNPDYQHQPGGPPLVVSGLSLNAHHMCKFKSWLPTNTNLPRGSPPVAGRLLLTHNHQAPARTTYTGRVRAGAGTCCLCM